MPANSCGKLFSLIQMHVCEMNVDVDVYVCSIFTHSTALACEMRWVLLHCIYIEQQHMTFWLMSHIRLWILMGWNAKWYFYFYSYPISYFHKNALASENVMCTIIRDTSTKALCDRDWASEHREWVAGSMEIDEKKGGERFYCYFYLTHAFWSYIQIYIKSKDEYGVCDNVNEV